MEYGQRYCETERVLRFTGTLISELYDFWLLNCSLIIIIAILFFENRFELIRGGGNIKDYKFKRVFVKIAVGIQCSWQF